MFESIQHVHNVCGLFSTLIRINFREHLFPTNINIAKELINIHLHLPEINGFHLCKQIIIFDIIYTRFQGSLTIVLSQF